MRTAPVRGGVGFPVARYSGREAVMKVFRLLRFVAARCGEAEMEVLEATCR